MALSLFNYFNCIAKLPSTGKIETDIESKIGEDVNRPKKRGEYLKFSEKEKFARNSSYSVCCLYYVLRYMQVPVAIAQ